MSPNADHPDFGVVVLTLGKRPEDLRRGLESVLAQEDVVVDVVVVVLRTYISIFTPHISGFRLKRSFNIS